MIIKKKTIANKKETFNAFISEIDFELLKKRGPDSFEHKIQQLENDSSSRLLFASSVLSLRGGPNAQITTQPLTCPRTGNILQWNGEIFSSDLVKVGLDENDSIKLFEKLNENKADLLRIIESIKGPFAFLFYERRTNSVYFGRDRFGRRSLLISCADSDLDKEQPVVTLSSVRVNFKSKSPVQYEELKANGIYKLNLLDPTKLTLFKWVKPLCKPKNSDNESYIRNNQLEISSLSVNDYVSEFNQRLDDFNTEYNPGNAEYSKLIDEFYQKLKQSVQKRVENIPNFCKSCSHLGKTKKFTNQSQENSCAHAKVAVLFSGGVDSAVLAALIDELLPENEPIDLLNIAFEQQASKKEKSSFMVPDRISGLQTLKELNPKRVWNFIEINIKLDELKLEREGVIKHLLYPHQTVLDDSIGCALWFASRGIGVDRTSNAEVLFLGMGADEQLAGYVRHRTKYEKAGMSELCREVKMEIERISERNLGRDDRILSDHGKIFDKLTNRNE